MRAGEPFVLNPDNRPLAEGKVSYKHLAKEGSVSTSCILLAFVIIGLPISIGFLSGAVFGWMEWFAVANSEQLQATVIERSIEEEGTNTSYYVSYTYQPPAAHGDARSYTRSERVDRATYERATEGGPITISYIPDTPSRGAINLSASPPLVFTLFSACWIPGFVGIPLLVLVFGVGHQRTMNRLRRGSQKLLGEVVESVKDFDDDNDCYVKVTYRFQSPTSRRTIQSAQQRIRKDLAEAEPPRAGTPVVVLYRDDKTYWML
jgi:hypothetical protein